MKKVDFDLNEILEIAQRAKANPNQHSDYKPAAPECLICGDNEGYAERLEDGTEVYKECSCVSKRRLHKRFESSKITFAFRMLNFDAFSLEDRPEIVHKAYQLARKYVRDFKNIQADRVNSICLLGKPGSGKTHLLTSVCNELIDAGVKLLYFPFVQGFNEIKDNLAIREARIVAMQEVEVLYIDDLWKGRELPSPFAIEQMFAVINYRYMEHKPIIVSSERSLEYMIDHIDEAIGSRLFEMSKGYRLNMTGGKELNYRLKD